ncbi:MAG: hypothetical protein ACOH2A_00240 [Sphingobacteriaceae bacterium]
MTNQQIGTEEKNHDYLYYVIGLLTGVITAAIVTGSFLWMLIGAILGLLSAALFFRVLVKKI